MAGLDGAMGEERVAALGPDGRSLLLEREHGRGGQPDQIEAAGDGGVELEAIPHRAAIPWVHLQVADLQHHHRVAGEAAVERQGEAAVAARLLVDDELEEQVGRWPDPALPPRLLDEPERQHHGRHLPLVVAGPPSPDQAVRHGRRDVRRDDVHVGVERQRAPPPPRHAQDEVGPSRVRRRRRERHVPLPGGRVVGRRVVRVPLDGGVDGHACQAVVGASDESDRLGDAVEDLPFACPDLSEVRSDGRIDAQDVQQEVGQGPADAGAVGQGEHVVERRSHGILGDHRWHTIPAIIGALPRRDQGRLPAARPA